MKYSRFWETGAGDRARSALRGVGRSYLRQKGTAALLMDGRWLEAGIDLYCGGKTRSVVRSR